MDVTLKAILIGMAVFIALLVMWLIAKKKKPESSSSTTGIIAGFTGNTDTQPVQVIDAAGERGNVEAEVRMLLDYGNKGAAIRVLREKLGLDLKDAAELADRMEHGAPIPAQASAPSSANDPDRDLRELVENGHLIEAIKLARERKGLDLKAAKAYVERLSA